VRDVPREDAGERRLAASLDGPELPLAGKDAGSGVAGAHQRLGLAARHQAGRRGDRRVALGAQGFPGRLVQLDDVAGVVDADVRGIIGERVEHGLDARLVPDQHALDRGRERGVGDPAYDLLGSELPAHRVHRNHRHRGGGL